ncbi:hypothetical protein BD769DRAFT_732475 [Suillus cothurnatus]|nr:hypothetical protein BD769DRAFT_732475 [Suillus cothurnatus]
MTETKEGEPFDARKAAGRYIPPWSRKQANSDTNKTEEQLKLTRQLKILINRMSKQNIATILDTIEDMYRNHCRHSSSWYSIWRIFFRPDVTSTLTLTLTNLIIDGISSHSTLLDSYVVLHAAFISSLHKMALRLRNISS